MYNTGFKSSNTSKKAPAKVSKACRDFVRSPLVVCAIIAYTVYAGISVITGLAALPDLSNTFQVMEFSFFLALGLLLMQLLAFQPIIVTVGLWQMFSSDGIWGADTVKSGISTFVGGISSSLCFLLAGIIFESESTEILSVLFDELLMPMIYFVFSMVAIFSLRGFAESVEYTAQSGKACTGGVVKVGTLIAIFLGLTLIMLVDIAEAIEESPFATIFSTLSDDSPVAISAVARLGSLLLFCISAFVFNHTIELASEEDKSATFTTTPTWQCSCGRVNQDYVRTCICGAQKHATIASNVRTNAAAPVTQPIVTQTVIQPTAAQSVGAPSAGQSTNENAKQPDTPTAYIFCSECGYKCLAQAKFCKSCGSKLN